MGPRRHRGCVSPPHGRPVPPHPGSEARASLGCGPRPAQRSRKGDTQPAAGCGAGTSRGNWETSHRGPRKARGRRRRRHGRALAVARPSGEQEQQRGDSASGTTAPQRRRTPRLCWWHRVHLHRVSAPSCCCVRPCCVRRRRRGDTAPQLVIPSVLPSRLAARLCNSAHQYDSFPGVGPRKTHIMTHILCAGAHLEAGARQSLVNKRPAPEGAWQTTAPEGAAWPFMARTVPCGFSRRLARRNYREAHPLRATTSGRRRV